MDPKSLKMEEKKWNFDEYDWLEKYDQRMQDLKRLYYKETLEQLPILVSAQPNELVLDIGTGTGNSAVPFLEAECRVIGIDPSERMLEKSKEKMRKWEGFFSIQHVDDPFLHIPYDDGIFDIVISAYAIHHLDDINKHKAITEMKRVLKANRRMAIADTMFNDETHKSSALSEYHDLEDEYQPLLSTFPMMFESTGMNVTMHQIGELIWVAIAKKNREIRWNNSMPFIQNV